MSKYLPENTAVYSRKQAAALGLYKFWSGEPCKHGHYSVRYVKSGICLECNATYQIRVNGGVAPMHGFYAPDGLIVHADDELTVREFLEALALARGFSIRTGTPLPQLPPLADDEFDANGVRFKIVGDAWISDRGHRIEPAPNGGAGYIAFIAGHRVGVFGSDIDAMEAAAAENVTIYEKRKNAVKGPPDQPPPIDLSNWKP